MHSQVFRKFQAKCHADGSGQDIHLHAVNLKMRRMLSKYRACLYTVQMRRICPARRRNGHEVMAEVHKYVDQMPGVDCKLVRIAAAINKAVIPIAACKIMARQQPGAPIVWTLQQDVGGGEGEE